ncbi:uncharacterized protein GJ701_007982 [Geothlypis trichas]
MEVNTRLFQTPAPEVLFMIPWTCCSEGLPSSGGQVVLGARAASGKWWQAWLATCWWMETLHSRSHQVHRGTEVTHSSLTLAVQGHLQSWEQRMSSPPGLQPALKESYVRFPAHPACPMLSPAEADTRHLLAAMGRGQCWGAVKPEKLTGASSPVPQHSPVAAAGVPLPLLPCPRAHGHSFGCSSVQVCPRHYCSQDAGCQFVTLSRS